MTTKTTTTTKDYSLARSNGSSMGGESPFNACNSGISKEKAIKKEERAITQSQSPLILRGTTLASTNKKPKCC